MTALHDAVVKGAYNVSCPDASIANVVFARTTVGT